MAIDFHQAAEHAKNISTSTDFGDNYFAAVKMENARQKLRPFGNAYEAGSQMACFYPFRLVVHPDDPTTTIWVPCLSVVYGHKVPYVKGPDSPTKMLHRSFIRSRCDLTPDGDVVGNGDLPYQFSRLAPILLRAQKENELRELSERDWSMVGQQAYANARQQVEDKYDPQKMSGRKPFLGPLRPVYNTVVYCVALDTSNASPIMKTADNDKTKTGMFTQQLSRDRREKLISTANHALFGIRAQHPDKTYATGDVEFLEVMYNFVSAKMDKAEAGRAEPQGVAVSTCVCNRFPDIADKLATALKDVPTKSDDIRAKLYSMDPVDDAQLLAVLQQYTFDTSKCWGALSEEDMSRLTKQAELIDYLRVVPVDLRVKTAIESTLGHEIGKSTGNAPRIDQLIGSDEKYDVTRQQAAVDKAVAAAEAGNAPEEESSEDDLDALTGALEV